MLLLIHKGFMSIALLSAFLEGLIEVKRVKLNFIMD
ncbi:MAG: hypothetical protein ACI9SI_001363 [Polaribacter sp.]|jgi:hypothetical protein